MRGRCCPDGIRCICITDFSGAVVAQSRDALLLRPDVSGRLSQDARLRRRQPAGGDAAGRCTGGRYRPCVYKLGLAGLCLLAPCVFAGTARAAGHEPFPRLPCLRLGDARLVGQAVPRSDRSRRRGSADGRLAVLAQAGLLLRYHRAPGPLSLLGVALTAVLGWYCHPLFMAAAAPLVLIYFFTVGARHHLLWHTCLAAAIAAPVAANLFWLQDWIDYWWLRTPLNLEAPTLTSRTLPALWAATIWGEPADRTLACFLAIAAIVGVAMLHGGGRRPAARMFCLADRSAAAAGVFGRRLGIVGRFGAERLFAPALMFAAVPAAHALARVLAIGPPPGRLGQRSLAGVAALAAAYSGHAVASRRLGESLVRQRAFANRPRPRPPERRRRPEG